MSTHSKNKNLVKKKKLRKLKVQVSTLHCLYVYTNLLFTCIIYTMLFCGHQALSSIHLLLGLEAEPRDPCIPQKHSTTELYSQSSLYFTDLTRVATKLLTSGLRGTPGLPDTPLRDDSSLTVHLLVISVTSRFYNEP